MKCWKNNVKVLMLLLTVLLVSLCGCSMVSKTDTGTGKIAESHAVDMEATEIDEKVFEETKRTQEESETAEKSDITVEGQTAMKTTDAMVSASVIGRVYEPDAEMKHQIAEAINYDTDWEAHMRELRNTGEDISAEKAVLVRETDHFKLYGADAWSCMLVETSDGTFLRAENCYLTSNYLIQPDVCEKDFDSDGEMELAVITYIGHGAGFLVDSLFMADKNGENEWCLYTFLEEDYQAQLAPHFETRYCPEGVRLQFDGEVIGVNSKIEQERLEENYRYYSGTQIQFGFTGAGEKIWMRAELVGCTDDGIILSGDFPGHEIDAEVMYQGRGVWQLCDLKYADKEVNDQIRNTVLSYFSGNYGDVKQYGLAEEAEISDLEFQCEPMEVDILDIFYREQKLDEGSVQAVAVLRRGKNDYLEELTIYLKAETPTGTDRNWRITRWYLEPY